MTFYSQTIANDPRFRSTERISDLALLEPVTRAAVTAMLASALASGLHLMVFETYRSAERQETLYEDGATQLRTVGVHHYGLAADIVKSVNGEPSWGGDFTFLGPLAKAHGLIWGGNWNEPLDRVTFRDMDHVQRLAVKDQQKLFGGTFYPDASYNPYAA